MSFDWPWALIALLVAPLLPAVRWWLNRRRKRVAVTVSSVALIRAALPGPVSWRRRVPVLLFLTGLLALAAGLARPQATVAVPSNDTSILLAIDVSGSMCSTDIAPNRLAVASDAARDFIEAQAGDTPIGLVAFSGIAGLVVPPTTDRDALLDAIDTLRTARGTAIGQAILTAIDAIAETNPNVAATGVDLGDVAPDALGDYQPDTIVVLTDGSNTTGVAPVTAAEQAAARRVRVYTIGFGTTDPAPMVCTADQISDDSYFGRRSRGDLPAWTGRSRYLDLDEEALTRVADISGGRYFRAEDADELTDVLADLPREFGLHEQDVEISVWFALAGGVLAFAGAGLALWWNRVPGRPASGTTTPAAFRRREGSFPG
ncbi:VWA domain-containing protein [Plantactinospora sp. WMMB334]|uniref:VWA domain-containing protein n=1 Tax=Plantactinospora sp. WMMB334 TaxID=3404119 RepID=UPI003B953845